MVHAKEVFRIVLVFHGYEAIVIGTVRFAGNRLALVSGVVAIRACDQERAQRFPTIARPLLVLVRVGRVLPRRPGEEVSRVLPMRESRIGNWDSSSGSVPVFEERGKQAHSRCQLRLLRLESHPLREKRVCGPNRMGACRRAAV